MRDLRQLFWLLIHELDGAGRDPFGLTTDWLDEQVRIATDDTFAEADRVACQKGVDEPPPFAGTLEFHRNFRAGALAHRVYKAAEGQHDKVAELATELRAAYLEYLKALADH